jgi:Fe-S-cluster containining protein
MAGKVLEDKSSKFSFECKKCGSCCRNNVTRLFPWDVIRLCTKLKIHTSLFLEKYCNMTRDPETRMPIPLLKTDNACRFLKDKCTVYEARPFICRMCPIGLSYKAVAKKYCYPINDCKGSDSKKEMAVEEYFKQEGLKDDFEMLEKWKAFLIRMVQTGYYGPDLDRMLVAIFYDYDNFASIEIRRNLMIDDKEGIKERFDQMLEVARMKFKL